MFEMSTASSVEASANLIIRKGEYETGFEKGGQTREHAMLAKTQGVNKLIVAVNKMDDPTVSWSQERYQECTQKLTAFLKGLGYNPKTDLFFMPISAQNGLGIKDRIPKDTCQWYSGPSLLERLDQMESLERKINAPLRMPVAAKYRDLGTMIEGYAIFRLFSPPFGLPPTLRTIIDSDLVGKSRLARSEKMGLIYSCRTVSHCFN